MHGTGGETHVYTTAGAFGGAPHVETNRMFVPRRRACGRQKQRLEDGWGGAGSGSEVAKCAIG
eukprot:3891507-Pyramimonas_sp.AAC.1